MIERRLFLAAGAAALAAPNVLRAQSPQAVSLQIDGAAVPFYAPIYAGLEKGFFRSRGLDVQIVYAAASDILRNVASGNVGFGFPNGDSVIAARANGLPVKVVHTTYQRGIGALLTRSTSGIRSYADLKGKRVAITALGSPNYLQLQVGLKQARLALDDVKLEIVATGAIVQSLQAGQVDAIVFSELRKYNLEADGFPTHMILSNDFLPSFGNVVVTGDRTLATSAATVRRFNDAITESFEWVIAGNVAEALQIAIDKHAPTWKGQEAILERAFRDTFIASVWQSPTTKANGLGAADLAAWQKNIDVLAEYKAIERGFPAAEMVVQPRAIGV
ncbi:MAG: ABC transporter substrate-binding protein [Telmatospirillum sp.]|nr:ABC transporter substrate-binding protein [Telmatospirillum sp.]